MKKIRLISDCHGKINQYKNIVHNCDYSVQLGDLAFDYRFLDKLNSEHHKFIPGNHDNYDKCFAYPHCLGDFGSYELNGVKFFFIRGEFSIDWAYRVRDYEMTGRVSWWKKEELSLREMHECLAAYKEAKPDFVLAHGCPRNIATIIGNPEILKDFGYDAELFTTNTSELLQACFEYHQPKLWVFGHYHLKKQVNLNGTKFICLHELGYCDVNSNLEVMGLKF